ncbi:N-6 DNA methylase [Leucobacter sp. HY1908]
MAEHREIYRDLRNYLAGQQVGATHDEALLQLALKALLCSSYIQAGRVEAFGIIESYRRAWLLVRGDFPDLFGPDDELELTDETIVEVDKMVSRLNVHSGQYDPFGDLYEVFANGTFRGQAGQFFTPQNAVNLLIDLVQPARDAVVIDPACGAGGFLAAVALRRIEDGVEPTEATKGLVGIDKDAYLARLAAARLGLISASDPVIVEADSVAWDEARTKELPLLGTADVVLTNPPFGAKIVAANKDVQAAFELGYVWKMDKKTQEFVQGNRLQASPSPQVLFIERSLSLLRPGGKLGIVVPESLISSRGHRYVVEYLRTRAEIEAVIGMPEELFKTSGSGGTHTKTCLVVARKYEAGEVGRLSSIFMAEVKKCGNDSRGRKVFPDELPTVAERWAKRDTKSGPTDHLGYEVEISDIVAGNLAPRYYNPEIAAELDALSKTHDLVKIGDLIEAGALSTSTGNEVGKQAYGTGTIPFVRTSDISNWEVKLDPKHGVSEETYETYRQRQDVQAGDILMVRDGTYLIGTCAMITEYDTNIVYQSHLLKIRVHDQGVIDPYLLLAALSSAPVKRQITAKRATQDIIDTLGDRLPEIVLPLPKSPTRRTEVANTVRRAVMDRIEARELARKAVLDIVGY